jgi:hypothetical protein
LNWRSHGSKNAKPSAPQYCVPPPPQKAKPMYNPTPPGDLAALLREAEALDRSPVTPTAPAAPAPTPTAPTPPVQQPATPPATGAPATDAQESLEALETRLKAAHAEAVEATRMEQHRPDNEAILREAYRRHGLSYDPSEADTAPTAPPAAVARPGRDEKAVPMSAETFHQLRELDRRWPAMDLFGTRIPGSRR